MIRNKLISIIGARPQFIKAATVSKAIADYAKYEEILIHTGQHYDANMSSIFFDELSIQKPKYNLGIGGGTHGANTGRMIEKIEEIILKEKPFAVLVYGDTDSTLAGAIATSKLHIPVVHVESGLRSFNRRMPEEINRIVTDQISDLLFTPNESSISQLQKEGIERSKIVYSGDVMFDATLQFDLVAREKIARGELSNIQPYLNEKFSLLTMHRAENVDNQERLEQIIQNLSLYPEKVLFPIHPRTNARIKEFGLHLPENMIIIDPIGYFEMLILERNAEIVFTDSGGVQKEAYFQNTPCITFRDETEWIELVEKGVNFIVGTNKDLFLNALESCRNIDKSLFGASIYGEGNASQIIVSELYNRYLK